MQPCLCFCYRCFLARFTRVWARTCERFFLGRTMRRVFRCFLLFCSVVTTSWSEVFQKCGVTGAKGVKPKDVLNAGKGEAIVTTSIWLCLVWVLSFIYGRKTIHDVQTLYDLVLMMNDESLSSATPIRCFWPGIWFPPRQWRICGVVHSLTFACMVIIRIRVMMTLCKKTTTIMRSQSNMTVACTTPTAVVVFTSRLFVPRVFRCGTSRRS